MSTPTQLLEPETVTEPSSPEPSPEERLRRLERELDAIHRITMALHAGAGAGARTTSRLNDVERDALNVAVEVLDASAGTMYVHDPKERVLIFKHVVAPSPEIVAKLQGMKMPEGQGLAGAVFQAGVRRATENARMESVHKRDIDEQTRFVTKEMLTVPLKSMGGTTLGVMQVLNKKHGHFTDDDWDILEILSAQAASAIETARLYEEARRASVINLIGDISHDVKNLLTPVVTGTQTLEMIVDAMFEDLDKLLPGMDDSQRKQVNWAVGGVRDFYKEAMNMVYDGANDAQERVREIADAIKGIISTPHFEEADFRERVEAVAKVLKLVAERKGVAIDLSGVEDAGPVELDKKGMYNALYNLINNAIPETPEGGMIMVRTRAVAFPTPGGSVPGLQIQVQDTGHGMPPHVRERMFTEDAVSTKPGGTGLGTRIVKNVVDAHHGTIRVDSAPGEGTTFTIQIPRRQPRGGTLTA